MIFAISVLSLNAQNKPISGTVTDAAGVPVIGAAVFVVGNTSTGAMTDDEGKYNFSVPANSTIAVSCIGYTTQTITIGAESVYNVMLQEDTQLLEETVVVGYGVQKKSDLTGSVASVGAESLKNQSVTDAAAALQGRASGVHIINSGAPGSGSEIRVRGYSSNSGNIGPLLIVDGLQVDNIQYLDPSMIESMEVLKDAASAAIYGAQAGNGVVLITTKTGSADKGRASVSYAGKATLQTFNRRPVMGREDFITYMRMTHGDESVDAKLKDNDYSHPMYDGGVIDTDWIGAYIEPSWSQQHSLTFSGGNNRGSFFTSLNYVKNDGVVKGQKDVYTRLSAQINADYKPFDWLTVGNNMSIEKWATQSVSQRGYGSSFDAMLVTDPLTPVYWTTVDEMSSVVRAEYDKVMNGTSATPYRFFGDENGFFANTKYNPEAEGSALAKRDVNDSHNGGFTMRGTMFANLTPFKGFTFTSRLGYRISQSTSHSYSAPYFIGSRANSTNYSISAGANTGYYYQWENFANYNVTIAKKHSISAMAGMSYIENNSDNVSGSASGADILTAYEPQFQYLNYLKGDAADNVSNAPGKSASLAYFGRLIYSYDNRYSIQANFRADAFDSSKLSAQNRWGYFPSVSAGWTISNEKFIKDNINPSVLSFLKFRASWGRNGNVNVLNNYPYQATIAVGNNWYQYHVDQMGAIMSSSPNGLPNPGLTWETSEQIDLGIDARFFNNRLGLDFTWYKSNATRQLLNLPMNSLSGYGAVKINAGNIQNQGIEIMLNATPIQTKDFSWDMMLNFSKNENKIIELADGVEQYQLGGYDNLKIVAQAGGNYGEIWGTKFQRVKEGPHAGKLLLSSSGLPQGTSSAEKIGDQQADYLLGFTNTLNYKNFSLSFLIDGRFGGDMYSGTNRLLQGNGVAACTVVDGDRKPFVVDGVIADGNGGYAPSTVEVTPEQYWSAIASSSGNLGIGEANLYSATNVRLRNLSLNYAFPKAMLKNTPFQQVKLGVSCNNVWMIYSDMNGVDPESVFATSTNATGFENAASPTSRSFLFNVTLGF